MGPSLEERPRRAAGGVILRGLSSYRPAHYNPAFLPPGSAWTICTSCGRSGGPFDYRTLEFWTSGQPGFWTIRATRHACRARVCRK